MTDFCSDGNLDCSVSPSSAETNSSGYFSAKFFHIDYDWLVAFFLFSLCFLSWQLIRYFVLLIQVKRPRSPPSGRSQLRNGQHNQEENSSSWRQRPGEVADNREAENAPADPRAAGDSLEQDEYADYGFDGEMVLMLVQGGNYEENFVIEDLPDENEEAESSEILERIITATTDAEARLIALGQVNEDNVLQNISNAGEEEVTLNSVQSPEETQI